MFEHKSKNTYFVADAMLRKLEILTTKFNRFKLRITKTF